MITGKFPGQRRKDVILLPLWIHQRLNSKRLDINVFLDFNRISQIFSVNDLALVVALQDKAHYIVGDLAPTPFQAAPPPGKNYFTDGYAIRSYWQSSALTKDQEATIETIYQLAEMPSVSKEIDERLFVTKSQQQADTSQTSDQPDTSRDPFIVNDVDSNVCIMTIKPGYFSTQQNETKRLRDRALDDILRSFYRSLPAHEVSRTIWFTRLLDTLAGA